MNAHVVWERFFELSDVRSDVEESGDHEMWVGRDASGEEEVIAYDELLGRVFDASPGDLRVRIDPRAFEVRALRGAPRTEPIDTSAHREVLEAALGGFTFFGPDAWAQGEAGTSWI